MATKQEDIDRIADYLTVPIPHRPAKPAKARKTWRTLEVGRAIKNTVPVVLKFAETLIDIEIPSGHWFKVVMLDEDGAWLEHDPTLVRLRLEDTKWQEKFEKIPKRRSKRSSG